MQDITLNFDASTVAPRAAMDPIPSGWQNAVITDSEMVPAASDPNNQMLSLTLTIIDGPYAGRKLYDRLNLVNTNPQAVEIAYGTLSAICHATGVVRCAKAAELHNRPMKVKVKLAPAEQKRDAAGNITKEYDAKNVIKAYDSPNSDHAVGASMAGGIAGAPVGSPPWAAGAPPQPQTGTPGFSPAPVATAAPVAAAGGWTPPAGGQPWANGGTSAPAAPTPPAVPAAPAAFPPDGWTAHPTSPGWFYRGQEVLSEEQLRAQSAAPVAPAFTAPVVPGVPAAATPGGPTPPWART